jgi:hypothetical protein
VPLTVPLAVEKVLFRLALREGGRVSLSRVFLELPCCLEEVEQAADTVADGISVVKDEWGEFLAYEFPELTKSPPIPATDCPTCGGEAPPAPTEAGHEVRAPLVCDSCFRGLRVARTLPEHSRALDKVKAFFTRASANEELPDPVKLARLDHEIFAIGLGLGVEQFTHTMIAAHSRLPAADLKTRLDRMAARRYIRQGLLPSGDAVGYRFAPGLSYPRILHARFAEPSSTGKAATAKVVKPEPSVGEVKFDPKPATPPAPAAPPLKIVIKGKPRDRR